MERERLRQIEQLYHTALELEENKRADYLREVCRGTRHCSVKWNRCWVTRLKRGLH
jgi:hypothetical protein